MDMNRLVSLVSIEEETPTPDKENRWHLFTSKTAPLSFDHLSARASTLGGIVRPICFAVFRLMVSSKLVNHLRIFNLKSAIENRKLLDHLPRARQDVRRNSKPKGLGGLEIDH